ncbi:hypothetical protein FRX31_011173 [Thalictrum thalictroides]|uniref:Uncharacterized protein n=1 Tax=Thalictrum thalictroides TaxID=46969 RepID=A0A7J6WPD6_THATH|nr:hypothetical protein FRX31_011173 [Thalictrum thalictroides]
MELNNSSAGVLHFIQKPTATHNGKEMTKSKTTCKAQCFPKLNQERKKIGTSISRIKYRPF